MTLNSWAVKWGVPPEAVADLRAVFLGEAAEFVPTGAGNEATVSAKLRLAASQAGWRLWRNNNGAGMDERGHFIRWGLANDSKRVNEMMKSSDLIGLRPINIGGYTIGQFVAREVKAPGWKFASTPREIAQLKFLQLVAALGGDAAFSTGELETWI